MSGCARRPEAHRRSWLVQPPLIPQTIGFQAYDDRSGTNPAIQVTLVRKESSTL
jgi:hypothetical protein